MAGIADLVATRVVLIGMGIKHVGRVAKIMAGAIAAKCLSMTLVTFLFLSLVHISVFDGPAKISVGIRDRAGNDW